MTFRTKACLEPLVFLICIMVDSHWSEDTLCDDAYMKRVVKIYFQPTILPQILANFKLTCISKAKCAKLKQLVETMPGITGS